MKHTDTKATSSPANAYNNPNRKKKWFDTCQETSSEGQTNHRACEEVFNRPLLIIPLYFADSATSSVG